MITLEYTQIKNNALMYFVYIKHSFTYFVKSWDWKGYLEGQCPLILISIFWWDVTVTLKSILAINKTKQTNQLKKQTNKQTKTC